MKLLIRNGAISGCIEDYIDPFWVLLKTEEKVEWSLKRKLPNKKFILSYIIENILW